MCYHMGHVKCLITLDSSRTNSDSKATKNSEKSCTPWKVTCPPNLELPVWTVLGWGGSRGKESVYSFQTEGHYATPFCQTPRIQGKSVSPVCMPVTSALSGWGEHLKFKFSLAIQQGTVSKKAKIKINKRDPPDKEWSKPIVPRQESGPRYLSDLSRDARHLDLCQNHDF